MEILPEHPNLLLILLYLKTFGYSYRTLNYLLQIFKVPIGQNTYYRILSYRVRIGLLGVINEAIRDLSLSVYMYIQACIYTMINMFISSLWC